MGILSWLTGSAKKNLEDAAQLSATEASKCAEDLANGKSISFSMGEFQIAVNVEQQKVIVNTTELFPWEFARRVFYKTSAHSTGGWQPVIGGNGGSVYVAGKSFCAHKTEKLEILRLSAQQERYLATESNFSSFTGEPNSRCFWANLDLNTLVMGDNGEKVKCVAAVTDYSAGVALNQVVELSIAIEKWCMAETEKHYLELAEGEFDDICTKAGLAENYFKKHDGASRFRPAQGVGIDHLGKMVVMKGDDIWMGSLLGAFAQIVDKTLDVKVDDPTYRERHLTERHLMIFENQPREVLVEWEERINLLAKKLAAAA